MHSIKDSASLKEAIAALEIRQELELKLLKIEFQETIEGLKPMNLLKNAFRQVTEAPDLKNNLLNTVIGLATGYLTKKVFIGSTHNPIKKVLGVLLQLGVTNVVAKNSDGLKTAGVGLIQKILAFRKRREAPSENGIH